ncbi:MAG: hypothetical protein RIT27_1401 [Pseudomonadota bacterium]|jgi:putative thioredoxin
MADQDFIVDVSQNNFEEKVLIQSQTVPVLVDFWADWCAPCKMLMPIVTKLAVEFQGQFTLAKINIDEQPDLARDFGVRSVPTLKLFYRGEVVDELLGAQPDSVIKEMLARYLPRPSDPFRRQAFELNAQNQHEEALAAIHQAISVDPDHYPLKLDLVQLLVNAGHYQVAEKTIKNLPAAAQADDNLPKMLARLEFGKTAENAPDLDTLQRQLAENENNFLARYQLSAHQVLKGELQAAMDNLLIILQKDRKFHDDAARKGLLGIFALLGHDPLVSQYRAKMSRLLY